MFRLGAGASPDRRIHFMFKIVDYFKTTGLSSSIYSTEITVRKNQETSNDLWKPKCDLFRSVEEAI